MMQTMQRMMMLAALCGSLAAPAWAQAQMAGTGTAVAAPADLYNKMLSAEEKEIVSLADAMPADKYGYAPTSGEFKGVRTFGEQVKHITEANYGFFAAWDVPGIKNSSDIDKLTNKDEIMAALRGSFTFAHAAMSKITADNAFTPMGANGGTRAGTATRALAHMMDHYGQLVVYLRLNGMVPPASQKPSR
ncbi:MAG TPA: DinB family protein [Acidobacteriaceae bacterium]